MGPIHQECNRKPNGQDGMGLLPVLFMIVLVGSVSAVMTTKFSQKLKSQKRSDLDSELSYLKGSYLKNKIDCSATLLHGRQKYGLQNNADLCQPDGKRYFQIYRSTFEGTPKALGTSDPAIGDAYKVGSWWVRASCLWDQQDPRRTTLVVRLAKPSPTAGGGVEFMDDPGNASQKLDWQNQRLVIFGDPTEDSSFESICAETIPKPPSTANVAGALLGFAVDKMSSRTRLSNSELGQIRNWKRKACKENNVDPLKQELANLPKKEKDRNAQQKARYKILTANKKTSGSIAFAQESCDQKFASDKFKRYLAGFVPEGNPSALKNDTQRSEKQEWKPEKNYVEFDLPEGTGTVELNVWGQWQGYGDADIDVATSVLTVNLFGSQDSPGKYFGTQMQKIGSAYAKSRSVRFLPTDLGKSIEKDSIKTVTPEGAEMVWFAGKKDKPAEVDWANGKFSLPKIECVSFRISKTCGRIRYTERIPDYTEILGNKKDINRTFRKNDKFYRNFGQRFWWFAVTAKFYGV